MSDAKNSINRYLAIRSFGEGAPQAKILYAMLELSGYDAFMDFVNGKVDILKGFESPADRTNFYFNNKDNLMAYADELAKRLAPSKVAMLTGMSYVEGKQPIENRESVVSAIFLDDDRYQPYFPILTSNLVGNVVGGIKASVKGFLESA